MKLEDRVCGCGTTFTPKRKDQFSCCSVCRNRYYLREWHEKHPGYSTRSSRKWRAEHLELERERGRQRNKRISFINRLNKLVAKLISGEIQMKTEHNNMKMVHMLLMAETIERMPKTKKASKKDIPTEKEFNASVPECKHDRIAPILNYVPEKVDVTNKDGIVVSTYKYQQNVVYLLKRMDGLFHWKSFINGKHSLDSDGTFVNQWEAQKDIKDCFQ